MFRLIDTAQNVPGPHGRAYVHDAARPIAMLYGFGMGEVCVRRFATDKAACKHLRKLAHNVYSVPVFDADKGETVARMVWAQEQSNAVTYANRVTWTRGAIAANPYRL